MLCFSIEEVGKLLCSLDVVRAQILPMHTIPHIFASAVDLRDLVPGPQMGHPR